jgi:hypothetical protein
MSIDRRYRRYVLFCRLLQIEPLSFDDWLRENSKIPEFLFN